jgi:broad specificity phosphatase PhoE
MLSRPDPAGLGPTRVYLVRHGQSTFNREQRLQGCSDEPVLTEAGAAGSALAGRHLAGQRFDVLLTSPLRRARQTACILWSALDCASPFGVTKDLREIDLGVWQGMPIETVRQRFPEDWRVWQDRPHELEIAAGDGTVFFPLRNLFEQARRFWRQFLNLHAGETALLVTHGGTARALIVTATGIGIELFSSLQQSNCGISILEFPAGGETACLEALNLTAHMGERTPKLKEGKRGVRVLLSAEEQPAHVFSADFTCKAADAASAACWDETVKTRLNNAVETATVSTDLFIAPRAVLSDWLCGALRIPRDHCPWKPFGSAVVHYPAPGRTPIVQTLLSATWERAQL